MSSKSIAAISIGTVGTGSAIYFYNLSGIITKDDIVIETPTTTPEPFKKNNITCNRTKTITINKLKGTTYYLCDTVDDTNTDHAHITKTSVIFPNNLTFATAEGSYHTITESATKQNIDEKPSFY